MPECGIAQNETFLKNHAKACTTNAQQVVDIPRRVKDIRVGRVSVMPLMQYLRIGVLV